MIIFRGVVAGDPERETNRNNGCWLKLTPDSGEGDDAHGVTLPTPPKQLPERGWFATQPSGGNA